MDEINHDLLQLHINHTKFKQNNLVVWYKRSKFTSVIEANLFFRPYLDAFHFNYFEHL